MTLEEAKKKFLDAQINIEEILDRVQRETGIRIESVYVSARSQTMGTGIMFNNFDVKMEISL